MKNRICAALLTLVLCLPLAGCAGGASSGISVSYPAAEPSSGADSGMQAGKAYTVGILQQMEHTSLDEIREAVEAGLARGAAIRWRSFIKTHREIPRPSAPSRSSLPHRALM